MGINFGYVRVGSKEHSLYKQLEALRPHVGNKRYLYIDKETENKGFYNMLKAMRKGDTLYIKSIDLLGGNVNQIKNYLENLKYERIGVRVTDLPTTMHKIPAGEEWITDMMENLIIEIYSSMEGQKSKSREVTFS